MNILLTITLITFLAGVVGTGLGGLIGALFKKDSSKMISLLLSFAAGIMLAVVCFDLLQEALNPLEEDNPIPFYLVVIFTLVGYVVVQIINEIIDKKLTKEVPHTSQEDHPQVHDDIDELVHADHLSYHKQKDSNLFVAGLVMVIVIALHNFPEGMVIGAGFARSDTAEIARDAILISAVIGLHNIPEGMAVAVPLIAGNTKKPKAILLTALSGAPTILGALAGYAFGTMNPISLSISLSLASGAMLYVVFGELLPVSILKWKSKLPALILVVGLLLGFVLVLI